MKNVEKRMVQSSLVCAPKGSLVFLMGFCRYLNGLLMSRSDSEKAKQKSKEGLYAMYNNTIPMLEMLVLMPTVSWLVNAALKNNPFVQERVAKALSLFVCMLFMLSACIAFRVAELRKDCCSDFDFKGHMQEEGEKLFKIPDRENARNSLSFAKFKFDWLNQKSESLIGLISGETDQSKESKEENASGILNTIEKLLLWPFFGVLFTIQLIELPFRLLLDVFACIKNLSFEKTEFADTHKFIKQDMAFSLYKIAEVPMSILPDKYGDSVRQYFSDVIVNQSSNLAVA